MDFECELTNETILVSELTVKNYKNLLKLIYGDITNPNSFIESLYLLLSKCLNKKINWIKTLSFVDLFCILIHLRTYSKGELCLLTLKKEIKSYSVHLNLNKTKQDLINLSQNITKDLLDFGEYCFCFKIPTMAELLLQNKLNYIKSLKFNEVQINFDSVQETEDALQEISLNEYNQLLEKINEIESKLSNFNIFNDMPIDHKLSIYPFSIEYLFWFTKLFFNETLDVFYKNFFYMIHKGSFEGFYLERLPVGEYNFFVNCLIDEITNDNTSENTNTITPYDLEDATDEELNKLLGEPEDSIDDNPEIVDQQN